MKIIFTLIIGLLIGFEALFAQKYERGLGGLIDNSENTQKYLALHRTLPAGTMLVVKNSANGRTATVKVIGKLPDTGDNDKVIVKVSKITYDALLAKGKKFAVELFPAPKEVKIMHKVEEGETLYFIAKKYKMSLDKIRELNELKSDTLRIGQEISVITKKW
jgi:LysM repeat protein